MEVSSGWLGDVRQDPGLASDVKAQLPSPGKPCPGFMAGANRCGRMVYSQQLQATQLP